MSIENEPLKLLMSRFRGEGSGGGEIETNDGRVVAVPPAFVPAMVEIVKGATLSDLADKLRSNGSRFSHLAKLILFLYDADLLADSRYVKLAEALRPEHVWSRTFMLWPMKTWLVSKESRTRPHGIEITFLSFALISLGFAVLERAISMVAFGDGQFRSPFELWIGIVLAFSIGRSLRSLGEVLTGRARGRKPALRLQVDLLSISLESSTTGAEANLFSFVGSLAGIGIAASTAALDRGSGVIAFAALLAFFAEASPFARSAMTDALKALYTRIEGRSKSGQAEATVRKLHVALSFAWILAVGIFSAFALPSIASAARTAFFASSLLGKIGLLIGVSKVLGLYAGWIEDVVSSFSYDEANARAIRRLWRRRPVRLAAFGEKGAVDFDPQSLPLLRQIDRETRERLLSKAQVRELAEGEAAVKQGEVDRVLYVVLEGRMAVAKRFQVARGSSRRKIVAILEPGSVFGEAAFFFGHERTADVVALERTKVLAIPHGDSMKTLETNRGEELQTRIWFLQALVSGSFLKEVPTEALDAVIHSGKILRVSAGQRVIQEGEAADSCYFIVQGRAVVTQNMKPINELGAGDAFGEIALLQAGLLRTATVAAQSDLLLVMIDSRSFWSLLRSHLPLALEVERLARTRLENDRARLAH